jgi:hypothetical protein
MADDGRGGRHRHGAVFRVGSPRHHAGGRFGPIGNMVLFTAGFFTAILVANTYGIDFRSLTLAVATGLGGAFAIIAVLAGIKGVFARF